MSLDIDKEYHYMADDPKHAMEKHLYCLNLSNQDRKAKIEITKFGYTLLHKNNTYWTQNL